MAASKWSKHHAWLYTTYLLESLWRRNSGQLFYGWASPPLSSWLGDPRLHRGRNSSSLGARPWGVGQRNDSSDGRQRLDDLHVVPASGKLAGAAGVAHPRARHHGGGYDNPPLLAVAASS